MTNQRTLPLLILTTALLLPGCSAAAPDDDGDTLIATREPGDNVTATPAITSTPDASLPTATRFPRPTLSDAEPANTEEQPEEQATQDNAASSPKSNLPSEGTIWDFGERGYGYIYEGNVCLNTTGTPVYLGEAATDMTMSEPSPNGLWIAYQRAEYDRNTNQSTSELRLARTDGEHNIIALTTQSLLEKFPRAGRAFGDIQWLPDSTRFLFNSAGDFGGYGQPMDDLYRYDAAVPELVPLIFPENNPEAYYPSLQFDISPDGNWIAVWNQTSLSFVRSDGAVYHDDVLNFNWVNLGCEPTIQLKPVWEPDSSGVTLMVFGWVAPDVPVDIGDLTSAKATSWFVPVRGAPQKLGEFAWGPNESRDCQPWGGSVISPDRQWIGYRLGQTVGAMRVDGTQNVVMVDDLSEFDRNHVYLQLAWLDSTTLHMTLPYSPPTQHGIRVHVDTLYFTATLDGTVTPVDGPNLPDNPLISCSPE